MNLKARIFFIIYAIRPLIVIYFIKRIIYLDREFIDIRDKKLE